MMIGYKRYKVLVGLIIASCASTSAFSVNNLSNSKNLLEVYQQAIASSPQLRSAKYTAKSAEEYSRSQLGLAFPNLTATASANTSNVTSGAISGSSQMLNVQLTLSQVLLDFGVFSGYKYSKQLALASRAKYNAAQQAFILQVAQSYFNVLLAKDKVALADANLKASESTLKQTKLLFANGMRNIATLKQAEATYFQAKATLTKDENTLKVSYYDLYALTGVIEKELVPLRSNIKYRMPLHDNESYWLELAKKNNFELISQRYQSEASASAVSAVTSTFLPNFTLVANYGVSNYTGSQQILSVQGITAPHVKTGYIGLNMSWNIFSGGVNFAERVQAANNYDASIYTTVNQTRVLEAQTSNDFHNLKALVDQIKALSQSVKSSKLSYQQFLERYRIGTATITDVLDQQNSLFESTTKLASSRYDYINAMLQLKYDAGSISLKDIQYFNSWLTN
jgi:outer membrane protein